MLKRYNPKHNPELNKLSSVVLDQALLSLTTLLTTVVLARTYSKNDYADVVLLFTITLFILGFQSGIISKPFAINLNDFKSKFFEKYYHFSLQLKLIYTVVIILAFPILYYFTYEEFIFSKFFFFLIYIISYSSYYFVRETLLSLRKTKENLYYAIFCSFSLITLLVVIFVNKFENVEFFLFGASITYSVLSCFYAIMNVKKIKLFKKQYIIFWLSNWKVGKWLLGSNFLFHLSSNIYPWLLLYITTKDNVAVFGVLMSAASLVNPLLTAFSSYLLPIFVRQNKSYSNINNSVSRWLFVFVFMSVILVLVGYYFGSEIIGLLFGVKYKNLGYIVIYPFLVQAINIIFQPYKIALIAVKRTDVNFWILIPRSIISLTLGYFFILKFGIFGVFYTMIIENVFYQICYFVLYKRIIKVG